MNNNAAHLEKKNRWADGKNMEKKNEEKKSKKLKMLGLNGHNFGDIF